MSERELRLIWRIACLRSNKKRGNREYKRDNGTNDLMQSSRKACHYTIQIEREREREREMRRAVFLVQSENYMHRS